MNSSRCERPSQFPLSLVLLLAVLLGPFLASCGPRISDVDKSDPGILARLKAELKSNSLSDVRFLDINVNLGTVTLSGLAESKEQKEKIAAIARHVPGVRQVVDNLAVQEE